MPWRGLETAKMSEKRGTGVPLRSICRITKIIQSLGPTAGEKAGEYTGLPAGILAGLNSRSRGKPEAESAQTLVSSVQTALRGPLHSIRKRTW